MHERRLVGWWLAGALGLFAQHARAQSTAAFPTDAPAPPPPRPAPTVKRPPTPSPPPTSRRPAPAPRAAPPQKRPAPAPRAVPTPAPVVAPPVAPMPPPSAARRLPPARAPYSTYDARSAVDTRPPVLPYYDGLPVPPGYKVVTHPATGIIAGGLIGFSAAYGAGIVVGATQGFKNASGWLAMPVAGPWLAVAERKYEQCKTSTVEQARACVQHAVGEVQFITFVAVDGVFQLATAFLTLAGALSSRDELIREDLVPKVSLLPPSPGRREWALSVQGRF